MAGDMQNERSPIRGLDERSVLDAFWCFSHAQGGRDVKYSNVFHLHDTRMTWHPNIGLIRPNLTFDRCSYTQQAIHTGKVKNILIFSVGYKKKYSLRRATNRIMFTHVPFSSAI